MPKSYKSVQDLPQTIPVFPLSAALLLPRSVLPLNIFEPRYLQMVDDALAGDRVIGMIQPVQTERPSAGVVVRPGLMQVGCLGKLTMFQETDDGRYLITLTGLSRFAIVDEVSALTPYRQVRVDFEPYAHDMTKGHGEDRVDREALLAAFRHYLEANQMETDWDSVERASNEFLVNTLCVMSPFGAPEKQAFLEADSLTQRAETLIAVAEMAIATANDEAPTIN